MINSLIKKSNFHCSVKLSDCTGMFSRTGSRAFHPVRSKHLALIAMAGSGTSTKWNFQLVNTSNFGNVLWNVGSGEGILISLVTWVTGTDRPVVWWIQYCFAFAMSLCKTCTTDWGRQATPIYFPQDQEGTAPFLVYIPQSEVFLSAVARLTC